MCFITVDLGTTNIKVATYDETLRQLAIVSETVEYMRNGDLVEFDAEDYFQTVARLITKCCKNAFPTSPYPVREIVLTGQAESLILISEKGRPIRNGISWMDMRSRAECEELQNSFDVEQCYHITGQPSIIPTWPITKILWLKRHEPKIFEQTKYYLLIKDYIQMRLTGIIAGEYSVYNFSHYFDICKKQYWHGILDYVGVNLSQLPALVEPCTVIGRLTQEAASLTGLSKDTKVNVGTLDHFSGMIGTGNIKEGIISESTGTVLGIATMVNMPLFSKERVPCHYGPFPNTYVLLPVCESGGISLEWFKNELMSQTDYADINQNCSIKKRPGSIVFLPYLTGINAPDFNKDASGVFFGLNVNHNQYDLALAVMEGVAHMLRSNIDSIEQAGIKATGIISTGGGARSDLWCQIKADITNYPIMVPENEEASCLGCAIIGAVAEGIYHDYKSAVDDLISIRKNFNPQLSSDYAQQHNLYNKLYFSLADTFRYHSMISV